MLGPYKIQLTLGTGKARTRGETFTKLATPALLVSLRRRKTINDELQDGSATHVLEEEPPYYVEQLHWTEHSRSEKC